MARWGYPRRSAPRERPAYPRRYTIKADNASDAVPEVMSAARRFVWIRLQGAMKTVEIEYTYERGIGFGYRFNDDGEREFTVSENLAVPILRGLIRSL